MKYPDFLTLWKMSCSDSTEGLTGPGSFGAGIGDSGAMGICQLPALPAGSRLGVLAHQW